MSTAVAAPNPAPMPHLDRHPSPRSYAPLAPAAVSTPSDRYVAIHSSSEPQPATTPNERSPADGKKSPNSYAVAMSDEIQPNANSHRSRSLNPNPKIIVKKEPPSSPSISQGARHRPRKLDLNIASAVAGPLSSRPSGGASLHDVGIACLSPGFQTHDPAMREQLQRSISVRDQQRSIIEARLLKSAKGDGPEGQKTGESPSGFGRAPPPSTKKRPAQPLSIVPPAAERFANERVIQSAPLGQTFTGRHNPPPTIHEPSAHGPHQQMYAPPPHAQPAMQTHNRLPPISDVFGGDNLQPVTTRPPFLHANSTPAHTHGPPLPSPGFPPQTAHPASHGSQQPHFQRPREYRSAEEAVQEMTGGREDLQPRLVHYNGRQPPTPPSPNPNPHHTPQHHKSGYENGAGRRRTRNEYEGDSSPPLGTGPDRAPRIGPFGAGRDSPATTAAKKDRFMSLVSEAWDLWHS